jgi:hypothetical protein
MQTPLVLHFLRKKERNSSLPEVQQLNRAFKESKHSSCFALLKRAFKEFFRHLKKFKEENEN